jgi:hypothetical protein
LQSARVVAAIAELGSFGNMTTSSQHDRIEIWRYTYQGHMR